MKRIAIALTVLLASACSKSPELQRVDTLFINGTVLTLDADFRIESAIALDDGVIVAVGGNELESRYDAAETIDLHGQVIMPGFVDSHTHLSGVPHWYIDLTRTTSIEQLKKQVSEMAGRLGPGEWITGYGWSEDQMSELRKPVRADLDVAAPDNPVYLTRAGGHSSVANTMAFRIAEIDTNTPDPDGGVIEKDAGGELNGVIREPGDLIDRHIPVASYADVRDSLISVLKNQFAFGITSFVHATGSIESYPEWQLVYEQNRGQLPRAAVQVYWEGPEAMTEFGLKSGDGDEFLKVGPIKIFVDGGFTGPAAYTKAPYKGEDSYRGMLSIEPDVLTSTIREASAAGWQLGIHAIGDAAIELTVVELIEALQQAPRDNHRHYLNHFTVMPSAETMQSMATNGIAITQQPNFTYTLEGRYVEYLDGARLEHNNALRTPMDHGVHVAISSDILPIGPMVGIYAAVTRQGPSGRVFGQGESLAVMEALRGYTWGGAWLNFEEDFKGTIEVGKVADLIVLDRNIVEIDPEDILDVEVVETWLGGRKVYARSGDSM